MFSVFSDMTAGWMGAFFTLELEKIAVMEKSRQRVSFKRL